MKRKTARAWICVGPDAKGKIVIQEHVMSRSKRLSTREMGRGKITKWRDWRRLGWRCVQATIIFHEPRKPRHGR